MKPLPTVAIAVLSLTAGTALGWWRRGSHDAGLAQKSAGESNGAVIDASGAVTRPKSGRAGKNGTAVTVSTGQNAAGSAASAQNPVERAKALLETMLTRGTFGSDGPPTEIFDFLQALSVCDGPALADLLASLDAGKAGKGKNNRDAGEIEVLILARYATADPEAAIARIAQATPDRPRNAEMALIMAFGSLGGDAARAQKLIDQLPDSLRPAGESAWLMARAKSDPEGTMREMLARPNLDDKSQRIAQSIVGRMLQTDPDKAMAMATQMGSGEQRGKMVNEVFRMWANNDPQAAGIWAKAHESADLYAAYFQANKDIKPDDPISPADLRNRFSSLEAGETSAKANLARYLASDLAKTNPQQALQWAATLSGQDKAAAESAAASRWIDKDPVAASEWVASQPEGPIRDGLASSLAIKIAADDPEAALRWAGTIGEGAERLRAQRGILKNARKDSPAILQFLQSLPPEARADLEARTRRE